MNLQRNGNRFMWPSSLPPREEMYRCPCCNQKLGLLGVERSPNYAGNKKWYQLSHPGTQCKLCKAPIKAKFILHKTRYLLMVMLLILVVLIMTLGETFYSLPYFHVLLFSILGLTMANNFLIEYVKDETTERNNL